jgi:lactoylglutathione lyase
MPQIIGQICFNVTDIERSIDFWQNVMGIPLQSRTEIPGVLEAVHQAPEGGSRIQLAQWLEREGPIDMGTSMWKIYVNTSDLQSLYEKAVAYGCEVESEPQRLDRWPVSVAFVKDPDGYLLELIEYHEGMPTGVPDPKASTRS